MSEIAAAATHSTNRPAQALNQSSKEVKYVVHPVQVHVTKEQLIAAGGRILATYGAAHAVAVPEAAVAGFLQRMSATKADLRELAHGIHTPGRSIDPRVDVPPVAEAGAGLFVLQYVAPAMPAWQQELRDLGVVAIQSLPERAAVVVATRDQIAVLATAPWLEYVGLYASDYKFAPAGPGRGEFVIQIADTATTADAISRIEERVGGFVTRTTYEGLLTARFRGDFGAARSLLTEPFVLGLETYVPPQPSDERQTLSLMGTRTMPNAVQTAYGGSALSPAGPYRAWLQRYGFTPTALSSSNIVVDIADTGLDMGCYGSSTGTRRHADLIDRVAYNNGTTTTSGDLGASTSPPFKDPKGHGTVLAGIVAANPPSDGTAKDIDDGYGSFYYGMGVAPGLKLGNTIMMGGIINLTQFGNVRDWTTRAVTRYCNTPASPCTATQTLCRATVQNHSNNEYMEYGENSGYYTTNAQLFDISVRRADHVSFIPLAITTSAGNIGQVVSDTTSTVITPATAKNVITVGAVETFRNQTSETNPCLNDGTQGTSSVLRNQGGGWDVLAFGSRRGTADNRVKPDILAPATLAAGPLADNAAGRYCFQSTIRHNANPANPRYHGASGTSFASPVAAGSIGLLRHFYSRSGFVPTPAMYKAMLVAGARSIRGGHDRYTGTTITAGLSSQTSFGVIGLDNLFSPTVARDWRDQDRLLLQSQVASYTITVSDPSKPLKIVLTWTDKEGAVQTPGQPFSKSLVNDFDLKASWATDGVRYYGNAISSTTGYSYVPGCGRPTCGYPADGSNNVEMLNVDPARFGTSANRTFTLSVTASVLNGQGVPGASGGSNNQDFALFVVNGSLLNQ